MSREVFFEDDNYKVEYEIVSDQFHIHCIVSNFTLSVLKDMYDKFAQIKYFSESLGFDKMYSLSPNPKFCRLFCADSLGKFGDCEVMVWQ